MMDPMDDDILTDAPLTAAEAELDLLESYLDDALDPADAAALRIRLAADADLAATLDALRGQRAVRQAAFAALEPDRTAVERLHWRVRGAVAAEVARPAPAPAGFWGRPDPWNVARFTAAAAACVVLGFFGGKLGQGRAPQPSVATVSSTGGSPVAGPAAGGRFVAVGNVDVPIQDDYGRVVAHQHFATPDQARGFLEDLRRAHDGPMSMPPSSSPAADGPVRTVSELRY